MTIDAISSDESQLSVLCIDCYSLCLNAAIYGLWDDARNQHLTS